MAMFHFRIKSYKKPDGSKISAVNHVDYIRRQVAFSNFDHLPFNDIFSGNIFQDHHLPNWANDDTKKFLQ